MAIETVSIQDATRQWVEVTPGRSALYGARSRAAANRWEGAAIAGVAIWQQAVSAAGVASRMAAKIRKAGAAKYSAKIAAVGESRFGPGVQAAANDYSSAFAPMLAIIQGVTLPGKGPRGDPRNYQRVPAVGDPLHRARIAATAAGL